MMKNQIIEHDGKAYIVEEEKDDKIKAAEYVYDTVTGKYVKLKSKTIEGDYRVIPLEMVKVRHSQEVKQEGEDDGETEQGDTKGQKTKKKPEKQSEEK